MAPLPISLLACEFAYGGSVASATVLLVDDDEVLRHTLAAVLQEHGYDVTTAASVPEALKPISAGSYDVLLSDLHMPGKGDGLTVVSAVRHANPSAVTMLFSASRRWTLRGRRVANVAGQYLRNFAQNMASIDFSVLLNGIMTIADEDSQLSQAMDSYIEESLLKATSV